MWKNCIFCCTLSVFRIHHKWNIGTWPPVQRRWEDISSGILQTCWVCLFQEVPGFLQTCKESIWTLQDNLPIYKFCQFTGPGPGPGTLDCLSGIVRWGNYYSGVTDRCQPSSSTSTKEPFTQAQEHWTAFLGLWGEETTTVASRTGASLHLPPAPRSHLPRPRNIGLPFWNCEVRKLLHRVTINNARFTDKTESASGFVIRKWTNDGSINLSCEEWLAKVKYFMKHVAKIDGSAQMHAFAV